MRSALTKQYVRTNGEKTSSEQQTKGGAVELENIKDKINELTRIKLKLETAKKQLMLIDGFEGAGNCGEHLEQVVANIVEQIKRLMKPVYLHQDLERTHKQKLLEKYGNCVVVQSSWSKSKIVDVIWKYLLESN